MQNIYTAICKCLHASSSVIIIKAIFTTNILAPLWLVKSRSHKITGESDLEEKSICMLYLRSEVLHPVTTSGMLQITELKGGINGKLWV